MKLPALQTSHGCQILVMILCQPMQKNKIVQESDGNPINAQMIYKNWPKKLKKFFKSKVNRCLENWAITKQLSANTQVPYIK
jgi:hypothetical protein